MKRRHLISVYYYTDILVSPCVHPGSCVQPSTEAAYNCYQIMTPHSRGTISLIHTDSLTEETTLFIEACVLDNLNASSLQNVLVLSQHFCVSVFLMIILYIILQEAYISRSYSFTIIGECTVGLK